ncbi:unnamed protein product [Spirodela intermedia]|uniref:Uncharacterized protein n=1 Tax=Spirodela intermedia TaxID=51605 RepID=A0A7I8ILP3_SPIIN|nr:unnamed protein product [Spirodela intermedia]CAA6658082.1 unnamed protein product [Spirodela intermedia]
MATLRLSGFPATVTRRRGAGWRWGVCQGLHPQVRAARGGSSSHLQCSVNRVDEILADDPVILVA